MSQTGIYKESVGTTDDAEAESEFILVDFEDRLLARFNLARSRIGRRLLCG